MRQWGRRGVSANALAGDRLGVRPALARADAHVCPHDKKKESSGFAVQMSGESIGSECGWGYEKSRSMIGGDGQGRAAEFEKRVLILPITLTHNASTAGGSFLFRSGRLGLGLLFRLGFRRLFFALLLLLLVVLLLRFR
jgi:hypothetical protein